uniref:GrpE protein homolog n=1 Tax=Trichuris muris TaxID=70415 RepID=A0A5S6QU76_TRIMR
MQLTYVLMRGFSLARNVFGTSLRQYITTQRNINRNSFQYRQSYRFCTCNMASKSTAENGTKVERNEETVESSDSFRTDTIGNVEVLEKKVVELQEQLSTVEDKYKRALAENENLRARMIRQVEEAKLFGVQSLCKDLLEIADILQLAADSVSPDILKSGQDELKDLHNGVLMTRSQLLKIFTHHGLTPLNPEGEKFDPNFHEAVFEVDDKQKTPGTVAVVQKIGYVLHQRCLRAAQVGVVKAR